MCSQECGAMRWEYAMPVCALFVTSRSGIVFNQSASAITDHNQSAKDIDRIFSPSSMRRTPAAESRYAFYRIVNS